MAGVSELQQYRQILLTISFVAIYCVRPEHESMRTITPLIDTIAPGASAQMILENKQHIDNT